MYFWRTMFTYEISNDLMQRLTMNNIRNRRLVTIAWKLNFGEVGWKFEKWHDQTRWSIKKKEVWTVRPILVDQKRWDSDILKEWGRVVQECEDRWKNIWNLGSGLLCFCSGKKVFVKNWKRFHFFRIRLLKTSGAQIENNSFVPANWYSGFTPKPLHHWIKIVSISPSHFHQEIPCFYSLCWLEMLLKLIYMALQKPV